MAAPTTTVRQDPDGRRLKDGYRSLIAFALAPDIALWEIEVAPPGMDGGEKVDTTTMHNDTVRTYTTRSLVEMTDSSMRVAYDPAALTDILSLINVEGDITQKFSDNSTWDYYGALRTFQPDGMSEGNMPTAQCVISPTNVDPDDDSEAVPNYKTASGTDT